MNLGIIGLDSGHVPEFSRRINELKAAGDTTCTVAAVWSDGQHEWPNEADVNQWIAATEALGVPRVETYDEMLDRVDGVLVLSVNGARHLELATPALTRGLPTYIDKPLACDLDQAKAIRDLAQQHGARCYSASSLRFASEHDAIPHDRLGDIVAVDAFGPGELHPLMPGLFHYGVHTIELADAILGPGVDRVRCDATDDRHTLDLAYTDGRLARLRLDRVAGYEFGATVHGTKGVHQFVVDFGPVYTRLVRGMVGFFEGGPAPVELDRIVENVAVMAAGNVSATEGGAWVSLPR